MKKASKELRKETGHLQMAEVTHTAFYNELGSQCVSCLDLKDRD